MRCRYTNLIMIRGFVSGNISENVNRNTRKNYQYIDLPLFDGCIGE